MKTAPSGRFSSGRVLQSRDHPGKAAKIEVSLPRLLHSLAKNVPGFIDYFCEEQGIDLAGEQRGASL
jgi:hypothetical protein